MVAKKSKAKPAKKPKPEKPGKPPKKDKGNEGDSEPTVSFTRPELQQVLLGISEVTPGGAGSISQAQYDAIKQKLDMLFGEEPVTLSPTENEGVSDVQ